jgi:hypothetical protein
MPYPTPPSPGTVVPAGSLVTPSGSMGAQGPTGPTGVSANAGNLAKLGTDNLVLVPQNTVQGLSKYYGLDTGTATALVVSVNSDFQLVPGVVVWVVPANSCGASPTLNVNGTGAVPIVNRASIALGGNEIWQGKAIGVFYDGSSWRVITPVMKYAAFTNPGNVPVECAGYDGVTVQAYFTAAGSCGLNLNHLGYSVPVSVWINNGYSGGGVGWWVNWTNPAGTSGITYWMWSNSLTTAGITTRIDSTNNQVLVASSNMFLTGSVVSGTLIFL